VALPEIRYATNDGLYVACQQVGDGPVGIVMLTQWFSNVDSQWDVPPLAEFIRRIGRFGRVLTSAVPACPIRSGPRNCRPSRNGWTTFAP
jgi:hypothetical protein